MREPKQTVVLVTGASGYIGREALGQLAVTEGLTLIALDVRATPLDDRLEGVEYLVGDVRDPGIAEVFKEHRVDTVVHLASIVTPGKKPDRAFEYSVDVLGTRNVLEASVAAGVGHFIVTSSGAAYGYHATNPQPLHEGDALRGNPEFAYSDHKRQVEEMLAEYREAHPGLKQLILRPGTVLGARTRNQITALFEKRFVLGLAGCHVPFVFIWDQDVAACIVKGVLEGSAGIYNLAGDGTLNLRQIATRLGKPYLPIPVFVLKAVLFFLHALRMSQYGPEQVNFLRYRPVLANDALKQEFGYVPRYTTAETFEYYLEHRTTSREP